MKFEFSTQVSATAATVFKHYANVNNWHKWDPDLKMATLEGAFVSGASGVVVPKSGPKSTIHFDKVERNVGFSAS